MRIRFFTYQIIYIVILIFPTWGMSQDSTYVKDYYDNLNIRLGIDSNNFSYKITNKTTNKIFDLKPNETQRITLGLVYRFLVLNVEYAPHLFEGQSSSQSEIQTIQMRMFIKRFFQNISYSNIQGFYLVNASDFKNLLNNNISRQSFNDLGMRRILGRTTFVANRKFSYKAMVTQSQKQTISRGSFIPNISYYYTQLSNFNNDIRDTKEANYDVNFNAGYIHNFVFGKSHNFYTSLTISPGLGVKMVKTVNEKTSIQKMQSFTNVNFEGGLNIGYNSDRYFTGFTFNSSSVSYNRNPETNIENSNVYLHLFFGYRFDAPKSMGVFFDKIYKKKV